MTGGAIPKVYTDEEILALMSVTTDTIPNLRRNNALHAFEISILNTWSIHNMLDGVRDVFNDAAGILSGGDVAGGVLTAQKVISVTGSSTSGGNVVDNLVDKDTGIFTNFDALPALAVFDLGAGAAIDKYRLYTPNGAYDSCPTAWKFEGSNTGAFSGEETVLDTRSGVAGVTGWADYTFINAVEYRYYRLNITANVTGTDTLIGEIEFYEGVTEYVQAVVSVGISSETQPTNIHAVILADDAAITLNTDLKFYASVDDGATWEQIILSDSGDYSATERILTGSVAVAGTGTTIKYKIECTNANYKFYAVGLLWD